MGEREGAGSVNRGRWLHFWSFSYGLPRVTVRRSSIRRSPRSLSEHRVKLWDIARFGSQPRKDFLSTGARRTTGAFARSPDDIAGVGGGVATLRLRRSRTVHRSFRARARICRYRRDHQRHGAISHRREELQEDLRGATFGTSFLSGGMITALKEALKLKGLEYPRDYKLLVIAGGSSANLAALQSGQIAATTVAVPLNYAAEESGFNIIGRLSEGIAHFQTNAFVTRRSWAEKNRQSAIRFMKAMLITFRWMYKNPDAAVDFLSKERCSSSLCTRAQVGSSTQRTGFGHRTAT